ncbi:MAG: type 4a pilus biogenesis protein PilO [Polyangiaceae bacterium]
MAAKPAEKAGGSALDRLSPAGKLLVGLIFVALIGVLYFVFFYADLDGQITSAKQRHAGLEAELARAEESKEAYNKDLAEKTRREQLSLQQKKVLPDDPEMPAFLQALQNTATISGAELTSWTPADEVPQEFYARVPMKLTLKGKFHQIAKFVFTVGQLDRIINIENIQLKNPKTTDGDEVLVEAECLATAFRAVKSGEAAAGGKRRQPGGGH